MTTFDITIVRSYSELAVCSALNVASGRRQDCEPKYVFGNLTEAALESNRGLIQSLAPFFRGLPTLVG